MILFENRLIERDEAVVDIEDRGYQFGDGVYEVIRVYNGHFFLLKAHMNRLERSTAEVKIKMPMPTAELERKLRELVKVNGLEDGFVYLQLTRGVAVRTHHFPEQSEAVLTAYTREMARPVKQMNDGVRTVLTEDMRWLRCDIKSLNLLGNVLAKQEAKEQGATEAIFHRGETVTEGSSSNVSIIKDDVLQTHPANNLILNGITKNKVFELARENGISVKEASFTVEELLEADEVFITSTTAEITPVVQIDDTTVGEGKPGPVTIKLQQAFTAAIEKESYAQTN
ncbi:MAG TPA: D-amino-acid transaminase [Bacillales bacterium]|nr:D-amino-acid transaminase [Bacillales bacterium]